MILQNFANASASSSLSFKSFHTTYSYVTFRFVFLYQYFNASPNSSSELVSLIGMMEERVLLIAECRDTARLNFTPSSAIFLIILVTPTVESVIRLDAMFNPSGDVIFSIAATTLA